jgi:hypothetical protein
VPGEGRVGHYSADFLLARTRRNLLQKTSLLEVGPDQEWWQSVDILVRFEDDPC